MGNGYLFLDEIEFFQVEVANTLKNHIIHETGVFGLVEEDKNKYISIGDLSSADLDLSLLKKNMIQESDLQFVA
jgi:hypothetical protein